MSHQLPLAEHNALLLLFSALPEQVRYAAEHYHRHSPETSTLLDLLLNRYREEGVAMAMTMEEFRKYYLKYFINDLSPEERLKGLTPEEVLKALPREEIENYLKRLTNGSPPAPPPGNEGSA